MFSSQNSKLIASYETLILKWNFETAKSLDARYCKYSNTRCPENERFRDREQRAYFTFSGR